MQKNENGQQPVLIIAGMHRSGTSLIAALLQSAGLDIGQNLLQESPSNQKGHFENLDFFTFHQDVLRSIGLSDAGWTVRKEINIPEYYIDEAKLLIQKNASLIQPWGWKDPRTILFLNFWIGLIPDAKFLLLYRSPWEVIDSLYRRGDPVFEHNPQMALDVWMNYNQIVLDFRNQFADRCLLTHLSQVISNPATFVDLVSQRLSIPLSLPKYNIYEPSLLNLEVSSSHRSTLTRRYFPEAYELYQQLNSVADFSDSLTIVDQELLSPTAWLLKDWLDLRWLQRLQTQLDAEVFTLKEQLSLTQTSLVSAHHVSQNLQAENQTLQAENQTLQAENQTLQAENQTLQAENQTLQAENQTLQKNLSILEECLEVQLKHKQTEIEAMQTSKFWKLRSQWFKLKRLLHPQP